MAGSWGQLPSFFLLIILPSFSYFGVPSFVLLFSKGLVDFILKPVEPAGLLQGLSPG